VILHTATVGKLIREAQQTNFMEPTAAWNKAVQGVCKSFMQTYDVMEMAEGGLDFQRWYRLMATAVLNVRDGYADLERATFMVDDKTMECLTEAGGAHIESIFNKLVYEISKRGEASFMQTWRQRTSVFRLVNKNFRDQVDEMARWDQDTKTVRSQHRRQKSIHEFFSGPWTEERRPAKALCKEELLQDPIEQHKNMYDVLVVEDEDTSGNETVDRRESMSKDDLLEDLRAARGKRLESEFEFEKFRKSPEAILLEDSDVEEEEEEDISMSDLEKEEPEVESVEETDSEYDAAMVDSDLEDAIIISDEEDEEGEYFH
jgi:hypothetical protein